MKQKRNNLNRNTNYAACRKSINKYMKYIYIYKCIIDNNNTCSRLLYIQVTISFAKYIKKSMSLATFSQSHHL